MSAEDNTSVMTTSCAPLSDEVNPASECINISNIIRFNHKWNVNDFYFPTASDSYESTIFSNETNNEIRWRLKMDRNYKTTPHYEFIVKLVLISNKVKTIQSNCKFQLLDGRTPKDKPWNKPLRFAVGEYLDCFTINSKETSGMFIRNNSYQYININMTVICQINVEETCALFNIPNCTLLDDLEMILKSPKFSDITLCASGKEYKAHKAILAARSPVFYAMFEHEMKEKHKNQVNIADIDGEVLEELLRFIYTGKVSNLEKFASDLLPPAEKYGFEKLKVLCGQVLCRNISIENAAEILVLADMYNLDELKLVAKRYIGSRAMDVSKTAGWVSMTRSHPNLITEVLCDLSQQFSEVYTMYRCTLE